MVTRTWGGCGTVVAPVPRSGVAHELGHHFFQDELVVKSGSLLTPCS